MACGEPRSVRSRKPQCWFLPLAWGCPTVMPSRTPRHRGLLLRCVARIDAHGSKDRAKDASPNACDDLSCLRRVHTHFCAHADERSPPRLPSDIRCHRRVSNNGGYRCPLTDRPRLPFRRRPAKSAAFQATRMPFTATTREGKSRGGMDTSGLRAGSPAHAAHTLSPGWGECS